MERQYLPTALSKRILTNHHTEHKEIANMNAIMQLQELYWPGLGNGPITF